MAVIVPFDSVDTDYSFRTLISDVELTFDVNWNDRDQAWYFSVADGDGDPIVSGVKICLGLDLLANVRDRTSLPSGSLVALDTAQGQTRPGKTDLGDRVLLVFLTPDDLT